MNVLRFAPWFVAALGVLCALWALFAQSAVRSQVDLIRIERDLAVVSERLMRTEMTERTLLAERMINELAAEVRSSTVLQQLDLAVLVSPLTNMRDARAALLWTTATSPPRAVLRVQRLPSLPTGAHYQLWHQRSGSGVPVSLGTFRPDARGDAQLDLEETASLQRDDALFVTLEGAGGLAQPQGPVVLHSGR